MRLYSLLIDLIGTQVSTSHMMLCDIMHARFANAEPQSPVDFSHVHTIFLLINSMFDIHFIKHKKNHLYALYFLVPFSVVPIVEYIIARCFVSNPICRAL